MRYIVWYIIEMGMIDNDCNRAIKMNKHRHLRVYHMDSSDLDLFFSWAPLTLNLTFKIRDFRLDVIF